MKKRISSLLATMVLALFLCIPALATGFAEAGLYSPTRSVWSWRGGQRKFP